VLIVKFVVPRKSGRLTDVAGSLMEYVTYNEYILYLSTSIIKLVGAFNLL
jgi:hypothetical protein